MQETDNLVPVIGYTTDSRMTIGIVRTLSRSMQCSLMHVQLGQIRLVITTAFAHDEMTTTIANFQNQRSRPFPTHN